MSIGLIFLLKAEEQRRLIPIFADALIPGGHLLFTAPAQPHSWNDIMTGLESISLGAEEYRDRLAAVGLSVADEFEDEGQNHYYHAVKAGQTESISGNTPGVCR